MEQINAWMDSGADTMKKKAYDLLKRDIMTCVLAPGQRLVLNELAERYQIGNTPIRDALQQLVYDGFLVSVPRYGYIITPVTLRDVNELFELRLLLEAPAARFAALRGSADQIQAIHRDADFSYRYGERDSYEYFLALNASFHTLIARACGNDRLEDLLGKTLAQLQRIFFLGLSIKDSADEMRREHLELAGAIYQRDEERAGLICQQQILRSRERVVEALARLGSV